MGSAPIPEATQRVESIRRWGPTLFIVAIRLLIGGALAWCVSVAIAAPELPLLCTLAALVIAVVTIWRPGPALLLVAGLAPVGALMAPPPARAAELFAWSFLAAWLLRAGRPLSTSGWPRAILIPAGLYCAAVAASWLAAAVSAAGGVSPAALPQFILRSIPRDHLIYSSPEAETWTLLQVVTGGGMLAAALGAGRDDPRLVPRTAWAIVGSMAILAVATLADVGRQWAQADYGMWFLLRYFQGERFSLHLQDLNAAGSLYVLAALTAIVLAMSDRKRRGTWIALLALMVPALWLSGSRSSFVALIGGLLIFAAVQSRWRPTRLQLAFGGSLLVIVLIAGMLVADWRTNVRGSAGRAVSLRSQFSETTARMFASAPVFGVGVGRYFNRSAEFMSDELRALYGNENAHNYFAQQFAELGLVGGFLFAWLIVTVAVRGWRRIRSAGDGATIGLFVGTSGYLLTCVTGHPLLVSEAAVPFWIAFGAMSGTGSNDMKARGAHRAIAVVLGALLMVEIGLGAASSRRLTRAPADQGFHGMEAAADGTRFRWMTRHGVTYIPDGPGFLRMTLRAPTLQIERPLVVETAIAGRVADRRELPRARWVTYDVPVRQQGGTPFRRVDLRVNQVSMDDVRLGRRAAQRPITVMMGEIRWIPIR